MSLRPIMRPAARVAEMVAGNPRLPVRGLGEGFLLAPSSGPRACLRAGERPPCAWREMRSCQKRCRSANLAPRARVAGSVVDFEPDPRVRRVAKVKAQAPPHRTVSRMAHHTDMGPDRPERRPAPQPVARLAADAYAGPNTAGGGQEAGVEIEPWPSTGTARREAEPAAEAPETRRAAARNPRTAPPSGARRSRRTALAAPDSGTRRYPAQVRRRRPEKPRPPGPHPARCRGALQSHRKPVRKGRVDPQRRPPGRRAVPGSRFPVPLNPRSWTGHHSREPPPNRPSGSGNDNASSGRPMAESSAYGHGCTPSEGRRRVTRRAEAKRRSREAA